MFEAPFGAVAMQVFFFSIKKNIVCEPLSLYGMAVLWLRYFVPLGSFSDDDDRSECVAGSAAAEEEGKKEKRI